VRDRVISPEESSICEQCMNFEVSKKQKIFCNFCEKEFETTEDRKVLVKGKEFHKCPNCGQIIGVRRDDRILG
jgi:ribosomal protein L37AE/L43A